MKEYELTVLIHPDLEADLETPLAKVRDIITSAGGTITKEDNWGKKKLAYAINREEFAVCTCTWMLNFQQMHHSKLATPLTSPMKSSVTSW